MNMLSPIDSLVASEPYREVYAGIHYRSIREIYYLWLHTLGKSRIKLACTDLGLKRGV